MVVFIVQYYHIYGSTPILRLTTGTVIITVIARGNRLDTLRPLLPELLDLVERLEPRTLAKVGSSRVRHEAGGQRA